MGDQIMIIHGFYEFGDLPIDGNEAGHVPELADFLRTIGYDLVQGYNESAGYYVVERAELSEDTGEVV